MHFSLFDWVILLVALSSILALGIFAKKHVSDTADYLVAGRRVGFYIGTITLFSTETAILTFMYFAEMGYVYGFAAFIAGIIPLFVFVFLGKTGFVIKTFRELGLVTIPEYFQSRFSRGVRVLAGIMMIGGGALNFGVFPVLDSTFLNIVTGIPQRYILWTIVCLMTMVLLYTALGGMVSVVVTSYVQYLFLFLAMAVITVFSFKVVGLRTMVMTVHSRMGAEGFNPLSHPAFGWTFIFWQTLMWLAVLTAFAPLTIRAFAAESSEMAKRVFTWSGVLNVARAVLPMFWGIAALVYFAGKGPVPIRAMPRLLTAVLPPGLLGLVVVGLLAGTMSTYAGYLIAWGSIISQDIVLSLTKRPCSERVRLRINRAAVLFLAVFVVWWGLWYRIPGAVFFYLYITGNIFLAGSFWVVLGGLYWKKANSVGAYSALILGAFSSLLYFFVSRPDEWAGRLGFISFSASLLGMVSGSLVSAYLPQVKNRIAWLVYVPVLTLAGCILWHFLKSYGWWANLWVIVLALTMITFIGFSVYALVKGLADMHSLLRYHTSGETTSGKPSICATDQQHRGVSTRR
jgi:SSS family solute:Na+ symporter